MKSSRVLALVLSFNFGIFGGNVYAGNGHPLSEHTDLVGKYIVEEEKLAKSLNLFENACGIKYRQKADFFGYEELRDITLHNVYSAFSDHDSIIPSYYEAITDTFEILKQYISEILNGRYQVNGETQDEVLRNFCADVGAELSKRSSVVRLGRGLYGHDIFKSDNCIDIANGVIVSLMGLSLDLRYSKVGLALDFIDVLLWVATIVTMGCSFAGNTAKVGVTAANKAFWVNNSIRVGQGVGKANILRNGGYKILNGIYQVAPDALNAVSEFLKSIGVKSTGKVMAAGAISSATLIAKEVVSGAKDITVYNLAKNSKNTLNSDGNFCLSVQLTKQRVRNIADALQQLGNQIAYNKNEVLNSNLLVCALDRRNLNTWFPVLCAINRVNEPQTSFLKFVKIPGMISPTVGDQKDKFLWVLNKIEEALTINKEFSKYVKQIVSAHSINNNKEEE